MIGCTEQYLFVLYAMLAAICAAIHNYSISFAMKEWRSSYTIAFPQCFILIAFQLIYHLRNYMKRKNALSEEGYVKQATNSIQGSDQAKVNLILVILRGFLAALSTVLVAFISKAAENSAVSPSVILSIATLSSFTTALLFYFVYNEFLKPKHILGMISIVAGVLLTAFSKDQVEYGTENSNIMLIPISLALLQSILITMATALARESHNRGYISLQFSIDFMGICGYIFLVGFLWTHFFEKPYPTIEIACATMAGLAQILTQIFMNIALISGRGGLVVALVQTNSFIQLNFEIALESKIPTTQEFLALGLGIAGALMIALF